MILLKTNLGDIKLELDYENAPETAKNFEQYVREGFYDGLIFHRRLRAGHDSAQNPRANPERSR